MREDFYYLVLLFEITSVKLAEFQHWWVISKDGFVISKDVTTFSSYGATSEKSDQAIVPVICGNYTS